MIGMIEVAAGAIEESAGSKSVVTVVVRSDVVSEKKGAAMIAMTGVERGEGTARGMIGGRRHHVLDRALERSLPGAGRLAQQHLE